MEPKTPNQTSQVREDFLLFESRPGVAAAILPDAPRFTVVAVTHDFLRSVGMKKEDIVGKGHFEPFPESPDDGKFTGENNIRAAFEYVIQHKKPYELPVQRYDIPNGDGTFTERYWKPQGSPVLSEAGELLYIIHAPMEVTDQVKAKKTAEAHHELEKAYHQIEESQKALSKAHKRIIDILESTSDAFYAVDAAFDFTYVNKRAAQLWGKETESLIGQHYWTAFPKAVNSESYHKHYEALEKSQPVHYETMSPLLGLWIDASIYPSKDGGLSVFFRDITERKQAEMALKESEERFRFMVNTVPQSIWITDAAGNVEFLNKHWCDYCGEPYSDTTAKDISIKHLHPEDGPKVMEAFGKAMQTGEPWEVEQRNRSKEGEYRWFLNRATPYKDPNTAQVLKWFGVGIDIHDRKLAEQALRKSEEELEEKVQERTRELEAQTILLNNILTNSSNGISVTEMIRNENGEVIDARTILANDAAVKYIGLPKETFLLKTAVELDPNILSSSYGQTCLNTLRTGEPALSQYYMELTGRWQELTISKMDEDHLIHIFTDITPIKVAQLQLERTVEELRRSNVNLEEFAYAASHDLKEPVRKIHFFSEKIRSTLQERMTDGEKQYFERMELAAKRMNSLIDDLLSYSQISIRPRVFEAVNMNGLIDLVLQDLDLEIEGKGATVTVDKLFTIEGHHRQLQQAFQNLIGNSLKYSRPGVAPQITIRCSKIRGNETGLHLSGEESQKTFYCITVQDNVIGFEQQDAERIFNVFTRLHGNAEFRGTGIGLSIVRKVVENHRGHIWAEGTPGKGAMFNVLLPAE